MGIPHYKILDSVMFYDKNNAGRQTDLIENIRNNYQGEEGLIFGMCYSGWAIFEKKLDVPFFDCSWSGLDLYYNARMYSYMEEQGLLTNVRTFFWVIPYYFFDYDMSLSFEQYSSGKIFSMRTLDDWHHYQQVPGAWEYVENFRMFGDKISQFYHMPKWKETCMTMIREPDGTAMLDPIWFTSHEETAIENQQLMSAVFQKMETGGCSYCDLSTRLPEKSECCFQGCVCGKTGEILPDIGRAEDKNWKDYGV